MLGSTLLFPIAPDQRGTLAVVNRDDELVAQSILDVIETRQGERVMLPNYGLPDLVFAVIDAGFTARLGFYVEEQVKNYVTAIDTVTAQPGTLDDGQFIAADLPNPHRSALRITYRRRGRAVPQELIYPTWRLIDVGA